METLAAAPAVAGPMADLTNHIDQKLTQFPVNFQGVIDQKFQE